MGFVVFDLHEGRKIMKKTLLTWNVIFYAIQYSVSLWYVGYEYAVLPPAYSRQWFIFPAVYLVLMVIGIHLVREWEYSPKKSYIKMAIFTLVFISSFWGAWLYFYFQGRMTSASYIDIVLFPATLFVCSVVISVIYFVCAAKTPKENYEYME